MAWRTTASEHNVRQGFYIVPVSIARYCFHECVTLGNDALRLMNKDQHLERQSK